jgi:hypothetical protein
MAKDKLNPFKIDIAQNFAMGGYDLMLQVGGIKDETEAKQLADALAEWMTETGGWKAKVQ